MRKTALEVWSDLVEAQPDKQLMQYELTMWTLRTEGMAEVARWQYELYLDVLTTLWTKAADRAGVTLAGPAEQLARLLLAGVDGLILQFLTIGDADTAKADLEALVSQMVSYAAPRQDPIA
jgi:hypothetical protein